VLYRKSSFDVGKAFARVAVAALAFGALAPGFASDATAQERRSKAKRTAAKPAPISASGPVTLLVSLNQQRMFVYDANGLVTQTRVSTGRRGHETPKGIYSIIEKKEHHESNIYLGAQMPHMQRLTMTGIALHGGVVPGYAASGGCVRMPFDFARRFFNVTDLNQRVVIAPDVQAPVRFQHEALFSALPSAIDLAGTAKRADSVGARALEVADALIGTPSAHAAVDPDVRTRESAVDIRRVQRQRLADTLADTTARREAANGAEKATLDALGEARGAAKTARNTAAKTARVASKANSARLAQERKLKRVLASKPKDISKMTADRLAALEAREATERQRLAPIAEDAKRATEAAEAAAAAVKAADAAIAAAQEKLNAAKAETKDAANAEVAAKQELATFDRQDANRAQPVSVFVSSATGMVHIRQGFEGVIEAKATIENPEVPLDTFVYTALDWKDGSKTDLVWSATEVNEKTTRGGDDRKKRRAQSVEPPPVSDADKAARTLARIKLPKDIRDLVAEVVKPGSVLIVSSYDMARSETRYAGTDFVVQMPEVIAKITKPTPRPRVKKPVQVVEEDERFSLFGSSSSASAKAKRRRAQSPKSLFW